MDNIDGLCNTSDKINNFRDFIKEVCCSMCLEGESQVNFSVKNCNYFLTHQSKHMQWVLKRRFFCVPITYALVEK